ncbi:hypothetical protein B0J15DRAFT_56198 [Fusarium solani]|uniref:Uncharacterized protein n=1 Tax=Fusarium solani TaxID=169388 RepID=A0A9P9H1M9_FUSSL|nr:uncharacterized protein B0J15DRAFT_56198 [Fusarium solani]KAH7249406.1 hypothetical protein B0J15DRAFT_56198 [Fusarium solani]
MTLWVLFLILTLSQVSSRGANSGFQDVFSGKGLTGDGLDQGRNKFRRAITSFTRMRVARQRGPLFKPRNVGSRINMGTKNGSFVLCKVHVVMPGIIPRRSNK